jgi:tetratricopeptide (TPR) repeat protein
MRALVLGLVVLLASPALGANKAAAREAYRRALQHYNLGEWAPALESFKEAYRNYEDPSFLFNIAQCQRQLGQKQDAVNSYRAFLRERPDAPNHEEVKKLITSLENELREEQEVKRQPPHGPLHTDEPPHPTENVVVTAPPEPPTPRSKPVYKQWWLWTVTGVVVVGIGLGVGLGVGLSGATSYPSTPAGDGVVRF